MIFNMGGGGSENLTEQMTQIDSLLTEVEESLVGKASGANITPETVLKGYRGYKGQNLVVGTYDPATADADLIPNNIRKGVNIFGVIGTMSELLTAEMLGLSTLKSLTVKYTSDTSATASSATITHGLNAIPKFVLIISNDTGGASRSVLKSAACFNTSQASMQNYIYEAFSSGTTSPFTQYGSSIQMTFTSTTLKLKEGYFQGNKTYTVIVGA